MYENSTMYPIKSDLKIKQRKKESAYHAYNQGNSNQNHTEISTHFTISIIKKPSKVTSACADSEKVELS
jgi:hypothetical protein